MINKELDFIQDMFDSIAHRYDFLNRLLSLRQDVYWRREMVKAAGLAKGDAVLDAACGTCDVILEIRRQKKDRCWISGIDFSLKMLSRGRKKIEQSGAGSVHLVSGDALRLPFKPALFDALFIAFGIRNIMDRRRALASFKRCLKEKGRVVVLELTTPKPGVIRELYIRYFKRMLPRIGGIFSKNLGAYSYLPDSVLSFPDAAGFAAVMREAGFENVRYKKMTFGIVTLFVGVKG